MWCVYLCVCVCVCVCVSISLWNQAKPMEGTLFPSQYWHSVHTQTNTRTHRPKKPSGASKEDVTGSASPLLPVLYVNCELAWWERENLQARLPALRNKQADIVMCNIYIWRRQLLSEVLKGSVHTNNPRDGWKLEVETNYKCLGEELPCSLTRLHQGLSSKTHSLIWCFDDGGGDTQLQHLPEVDIWWVWRPKHMNHVVFFHVTPCGSMFLLWIIQGFYLFVASLCVRGNLKATSSLVQVLPTENTENVLFIFLNRSSSQFSKAKFKGYLWTVLAGRVSTLSFGRFVFRLICSPQKRRTARWCYYRGLIFPSFEDTPLRSDMN